MARKSAILVAGDMVVDQHIYEGSRQYFSDGISRGVRVHPEAGGAALIHRLLRAILAADAKHGAKWQSHLHVAIDELPMEQDSQKSYAFWRPHTLKKDSEEKVWRVSETMGFGGSADHHGKSSQWETRDPPRRPEVIVLSDGGMGFREDGWKKIRAQLQTARWLILKTTWPLMVGPLWKELTKKYEHKLIVTVGASELRRSTARLCDGLSWDETIESLFHEMRPKKTLAPLLTCRHLIVAFDSEGVLWLDRDGKDFAHLVFAAGAIEGDHAHETDGKAFGLTSCLVASVVKAVVDDPESPNFAPAVEAGLGAMRDLRHWGHGTVKVSAPGYPTTRLADVILEHEWHCARARFRLRSDAAGPKSARSPWSVLRETETDVYKLARLCVARGASAFANLPHLTIGKLVAVDRHEIESLRTLTKVLRRYHDHDPGNKPLSIGVFGPPGSGKSFAVKELAERYCDEKGWMEFNLSQFEGPADLIGAFHQIRDRVLKNLGPKVLPTAFFDEFDAKKYDWIQYLLAPMQDGTFQHGSATHTIGKCVLIFAGGTSSTFETFGPPAASPEFAAFRLAKGPDFKSRLDAYFNVVGPNQRQKIEDVGSAYRIEDDAEDISFPLRRALMIRSELKCAKEHKDDAMDMDPGVVNALLRVKQFVHGSRSLGKLLQPFQIACVQARLKRTRLPSLVPSMLPPLSQIAMHTDASRFLELMNEPRPRFSKTISITGEDPLLAKSPVTEDDVTKIAHAIHASFKPLAEQADPLRVVADFAELSPEEKASNRAAARRMVRFLEIISLELIDRLASPVEECRIRDYLEWHLASLAEAEHNGWMQWHLDRNWKYAKKKDRKKKRHNCLKPFADLDPLEQNKDHGTVRKYPDFARQLGKMIWFRE